MKDTPTEIKNNLPGVTSRVDEAENPIGYWEYKEKNSQNNKKKKESKKLG